MSINVKELKEKAKQVLKKRACIRSELQELIKKINLQLSEIPESDEPTISMPIRTWNTNDLKTGHRLNIDLDFQNDSLEIIIGKQNDDGVWNYEEKKYFSSLSFPNCRVIAEKFSAIFPKYYDILENREKDYDRTISIIEKLQNELKKNEEKTIGTINDLSLGDYAEYGEDIMQVQKCVHGKKFYAIICDVRDRLRKLGSLVPITLVDDAEEHYITACCG